MPSTNVGRRSTFALAEMILSVAVLVILAGFSVLMFISAKNNNAKSYDMYKAMSHAINVVETIKALPHPGLLSEQDLDPKGAVLSRNGDAAAVCIYFDETWAVIPPDSSQAQPCYSVQAELAPTGTAATGTDTGTNSGSYKKDGSCTYTISVRVLRLFPYTLEKHGQEEIVFIETLKCYTPYARTEGAIR